jgi:hypothetical protein
MEHQIYRCPVDVISGTIVLESIANIHSALKAQKLNEHNSAIISAKQQAHHSLGDLIR